jgi:hypothetical protein
MFADSVHLLDSRAAGVQQSGHHLFVFERDPWRWRGEQRRTTSGQQTHARVLRPSFRDEIQHFFGTHDAFRRRVITAGGPSGMEPNPLEWANQIGRNIDYPRDVIEPIREHFFESSAHGSTGLAAADDEHT